MRSFAVLILAGAFFAAEAQEYDLLLQGGRVIDPANGVDAIRDIAIRGGRIAAVEADIASASAKQTVNLSGLILTPGLVDIHFHAYSGARDGTTAGGNRSIYPDQFAPRTCTTTVVDPGSAGWRNFEEFRRTVIDTAETRTLAMLNIAGIGILDTELEQNPRDMDIEKLAAMAKKHDDVVVGIKSAHWRGKDFTSVERAVEAGEATGLPVMVDFGSFWPERPYEQMVIEILRPGDMSTHFYRWPAPLLDGEGKPRQYLHDARRRGVKFDVGHGGGSFHFRLAEPMVQAGFWPDSISTDAHTGSMNAGMIDMPTVMSKMLALGMPLPEVVKASTVSPAEQVGRADLGRLSVGGEADIAVFALQEGTFGYRDALGGGIEGNQRLNCEMTVRAGRIAFDWNSRAAAPWREADLNYPER